MLDVALVAQRMWPRAFTRTQRARIAARLGLRDEEAALWIAFWSGLHDLGKASPAFQTQLRPGQGKAIVDGWLRAARLDTTGARWAPHGALSQLLLETFLPDRYGCPPELSEQVGAIVGAHHGLFFTPLQKAQCESEEVIGGDDWRAVQERLARLLYVALDVPTTTPTGSLLDADAMALAGCISVADWIGSNLAYFPLAATVNPPPTPLSPLTLADYLQAAPRRADDAMTRVAWDHIDLTAQPRSFQSLFAIAHPRAMQQAVIDLAPRLSGPGLVIVESPMGEGKTEAAMYLADHWSVSLNQRGVYFALPSQATSDQMFGRVRTFLQRRFAAARAVNLHLAHGMSALSPDYEELRRQGREAIANASIYDEASAPASLRTPLASSPAVAANPNPNPTSQAQDDPDVADGERGAVIAAEWFAAPKRTLLSPYGVGTVDQALMAALQVKHGFVRLFGLAGKTIIVDEVHAYDAYMSTLLKRLLEWLGALGAPVVLLSATLPAARRAELLASYVKGAGWPSPQIASAPYPRVTYVSAAAADSVHVAASASARTLTLRWVDGAPPVDGAPSFPLAEQLAEALRAGGCAAIVCNTVARARAVYHALDVFFQTLPAESRPTLDLLHSQYLHAARQQRERRVLDQFAPGTGDAPNPHRPRRSILVATQVIEQSLDLDFDLMITDLAPIDLMLQRAGRLHRHAVNDVRRPAPLCAPTLWVCAPETGADGVPQFSRGDAFIYAPHILLRSWYQLWRRTTARGMEDAQIAIPGDVEALIEAVYDDAMPAPEEIGVAFAARWTETAQHLRADTARTERRALNVRILPPSDPSIYSAFSKRLQEDDPDTHATLQALTRDAEPSAPVVIVSAANGQRPPMRSVTPTFAQARALLESSLNFSRPGATEALLKLAVPSGWRRTPWLRHHRLLCLDAAGQVHLEDERRSYTITIDPVDGVVVTSHAKR